MNILVLNCGSSTLKFHLLDVRRNVSGATKIAEGIISRIGGKADVKFLIRGEKLKEEKEQEIPNHEDAARIVLNWLVSNEPEHIRDLGAVAHRVVHGGDTLVGPLFIDSHVMQLIEGLSELAPLHNEPSLKTIRCARRELGDKMPMIAVFDTDFHHTMPERSANYAIPLELARKHHIRRYGFHGVAHRYMAERYATITKIPIQETKIITAQLGSGCSLAAIDSGRSVDTTMGFTPLEGLMMATRSGDADPSLEGYLSQREQVSSEEVEKWLNTRSGLLGVSGISQDMKELLEAEKSGKERAALAISMFCYRVRKYIGAYLAALDGARAIVFGGGIGENSPEIRKRILERMEWLGIALDDDENFKQRADTEERRITFEDSKIHAYVIPVHEEVVISKDAISLLLKGSEE